MEACLLLADHYDLCVQQLKKAWGLAAISVEVSSLE